MQQNGKMMQDIADGSGVQASSKAIVDEAMVAKTGSPIFGPSTGMAPHAGSSQMKMNILNKIKKNCINSANNENPNQM